MKLFPLQSYESWQIDALNKIIGRHRLPIHISQENDIYIQFLEKYPSFKPEMAVKINLGRTSFRVAFNQLPEASFLAPNFPPVDIQNLPHDIQAIVVEVLLQEFLSHWEKKQDIAICIESILFHDFPQESDYKLYFSLDFLSKNFHFLGYIHLDADALQMLAHWFNEVPIAYLKPNDFVHTIGLLHIGQTLLSWPDYRKLAKNDIILLDEGFLQPEPHIFFKFGNRLRVEGTYKDNTFTITDMIEEDETKSTDFDKDYVFDEEDDEDHDEDDHEENHKEDDAQDSEDEDHDEQDEEEDEDHDEDKHPEEDHDEADDHEVDPYFDDNPQNLVNALPKHVSNLPVKVTFLAGEKKISLAELSSLKAGFAFELENPVHRPITIKANGATIGSGELLQIGDKIGVKVVDLYHERH